jgi:hypothetical protein
MDTLTRGWFDAEPATGSTADTGSLLDSGDEDLPILSSLIAGLREARNTAPALLPLESLQSLPVAPAML